MHLTVHGPLTSALPLSVPLWVRPEQLGRDGGVYIIYRVGGQMGPSFMTVSWDFGPRVVHH